MAADFSLQEVADEQRQVVAALAQRRQVDGDDVEAEVQVGPEAAILHALVEVAVGGGDDAHVDGDRLRAADARERALLEDAQQLGLRARVHLADLVEEDRAAVGALEVAELARVRVGEGAALVAEQLALEQVLGDGGAVDRHQRAAGARAVVVDRLGDDLFAGAALAGEQHGGAQRRDAADGGEHRLHRPAIGR